MNTVMTNTCDTLGWFKNIHPLTDGANPSPYMCSYFDHAVAIGLGMAFLALLILFVTNKYNKTWNWLSRHLLKLFIVAWIFGFAVYDVGMNTGNPLSLLANAPMAVLHAFGMFVMDSDVSEIQNEFHNSTAFMGLFSLSHFLAACVSLMFVIKHFGFNIIAGLRMFFAAFMSRKKDEAYVFWGMNNATYNLAESIKTHCADKSYRIIIVRTNSDKETPTDKNGMERLFNFLALRNKDLDRLKELECLTTNTFGNLTTLNSTQNEGGLFDILRKGLNMRQLCRIIKSKTRKDIHWFFLSDDEVANIKSVANLKTDKTINDIISKQGSEGKRVIMYCHTRNNSIHRVIEQDRPVEGVEVKVVDSSHLCVDLLKYHQEYHPVNYVEVEDDATVSSTFNSLVVGFGQVGMDVVRFLYEFGAFVKKGSTDNNVQRSGFVCNVVDKDMPDLAGQFVANAPEVSCALSFKPGWQDKSPLIALHHADCQSTDFYERLNGWIKDLNYAVVATGDDELNISLGVRLLRMAIRYKDNMNHFRVLVRVRDDEDGHIGRIARFYNRLWKAEQKKDFNDDLKRQKNVKSDEEVDEPITLFGTLRELYQYDYIVSEEVKSQAKKFKERYDESIRELQIQSKTEVYNVVSWDDEYKLYMQIDGEFAGFSPTYSNVMKLRRMQSQNFENCYHVLTKQRLAMCALGADEYALLTDHQLFRKNNEITYQWKSNLQSKDKIIKVLDTLAQTEHLRWNSSHEILGYMNKGDESFKDEARLQHGCLKNWQDLTPRVQSYDYNVVDVSLDIIERKQK